MNRVIFNLMVSAVTFVVCFATGYWMEFPTGITVAAGLLLSLVTFSALTVASLRKEPSSVKKRNIFLLAGVAFAVVGTLQMMEPYMVAPEYISWRGLPVIAYVLSVLHILVALKYNREARLG